MYQNKWRFQDRDFESEDIPAGIVGFIYEIIDQETGKWYIGKKLFFSKKRTQKTIKNPKTNIKKVKIKKIPVESDWKSYYSSSDEIKGLVAAFGPERFKRRILALAATKSELSYLESKAIFTSDALLKDESYNYWITCRINAKNLASLKSKN